MYYLLLRTSLLWGLLDGALCVVIKIWIRFSDVLYRLLILFNVFFFFFSVEELLCLATWKDGSTKYMIGKLEHTPTSTDEEKYRCFVVGKSIGGSFEMAQSGDATCNGMSSPTDGSRTMNFTRGKSRSNIIPPREPFFEIPTGVWRGVVNCVIIPRYCLPAYPPVNSPSKQYVRSKFEKRTSARQINLFHLGNSPFL